MKKKCIYKFQALAKRSKEGNGMKALTKEYVMTWSKVDEEI